MMDSTVATWRTTKTASNAPMESHLTTNTRAPESTETWRQTHQQLVHGLRISTEYRPLCRCTPCLIVPPTVTRDNENNHSSCQLSAHTAQIRRPYTRRQLSKIKRREIAAAATAGGRDAATSEEVNVAAAATAGQRGAATPLEQRSEDPEHARIRHEVQDQGEGRQQGPLATRGSPRFQYLLHRPGTRRRCQRSDPPECTQPCPFTPFFQQEELEDRRRRSSTARTPPAHKPPASISWCARRLRHEPFDERSAWKHLAGHLRTGGRTPHFFF